jgi:hypothetical protein
MEAEFKGFQMKDSGFIVEASSAIKVRGVGLDLTVEELVEFLLDFGLRILDIAEDYDC